MQEDGLLFSHGCDGSINRDDDDDDDDVDTDIDIDIDIFWGETNGNYLDL